MSVKPFLSEFRESAIPDRLALLNVQWVEGQEALKAFKPVDKTSPGYSFGRWRDDFKKWARGKQGQTILKGGWLGVGCTIDGSPDPVPYFKPDSPRQSSEFRGFGEVPKLKPVKYETAQGMEALPILSWVSWEFGWQIAKNISKQAEKQYEQRFIRQFEPVFSDSIDPTGQIDCSRQQWGQSGISPSFVQHVTDRCVTGGLESSPFTSGRVEQALCQPDRYFWRWFQSTNGRLAVCEGLKKAECLIAHGIPAIALRGICNWHRRGETELHTAIAHFAKGRSISIIFDQDEKLSTQKAVRTQILKLGATLEKSGAKVTVCVWDRARGKGIDDAVFELGAHAQIWLEAVLSDALDLVTYKRDSWVLKALETIAKLNTLSYPVERATEGEYLPVLPELQQGSTHVISASMDSGKTVRIGADWVTAAIAKGLNVLVLTPINNLGKQASSNWGLPHVHDYGTSPEEQSALWSDVSFRHGVVMCVDSLHRLPDWFWSRPVSLILDEANQVIDHLTQGDTLGSRYSDILERFTAASRHAIQTGAIVLSEDGVPDRAVNFVKSVSGGESVRVFTHKKQGVPWDCKVFSGQASNYRARFLDAAATRRVLYVASSQAEGARVERALRKRCPAKEVVRIDSETNQQGQFTAFFHNPDQWLQDHQPDILILSPSAKSGVSIEGGVSVENAYFASVWGYFSALATDNHWQPLGRYRPPVPRFIFVPDLIPSSGDECLLSPRAIKRRLGLNSKALAGVYGLETLLDDSNISELQATIETAVIDYLADSKTVSGAQKSIANIALVERLKKAGHSVQCERLLKDGDIVKLWSEVQEEIWRDQAAAIAHSKVEEHHTPDWALKQLDRLEVSLETRILAQKVLWRSEFPGVLFDDPEECYQSLCRDYGAMRRGVLLQAKAENLEASKESDRKAVEAVLKGDIRALHRLPRGYARSLLIAKLGVLELLDGGIYSNADPRCQNVKKQALNFRNELYYWLGLKIEDGQSAIEICHKLLKKLGLERDKFERPGAVKLIDRPGKRGQNSERFAVDLDFNPIRARLLEAARRKLSESVTSISNTGEDPPIEINVTKPKIPPDLGEWTAPDSLKEIKAQWDAADSEAEREIWRKVIPIEVLELAIA